MKIYTRPDKQDWDQLITRPSFDQGKLNQKVISIINNVRINGDAALLKYSQQFDGTAPEKLQVSEPEIQEAIAKVPDELKQAIQTAYDNIFKFHKAQQTAAQVIETTPGVECWRKQVPIEKVGLYIPGGSAPLFSTILMLGIPAQIAGCKEVVLCTPPDKNQQINPSILYTAQLTGISNIYKVGGAQAIAAMSFGTESIPKTYKIFGPGNQYVTKAKELLQQNIAIDMPAGPSEVLVIADKSSKPAFVAADLLSQAEHGDDSQVILLSDDEQVVHQCIDELVKQLDFLPRKETARRALENSKAIVFDSITECIELSNLYAPEHLIIASEQADEYVDNIVNAGSVFLGNYSCESAGDYASGTNHTLPTNAYARSYSGVSLDSFVKNITYQKISKSGIQTLGPTIQIMAAAEGLDAHKYAVSVRLKALNND